jgi:hypothetical protein
MSTRRRFLASLAAAPLLPAQATSPPSPSSSPAPSPATPGPVAEALAAVVRHRYGSQLDAADVEEIKKTIGESLEAAGKLKKLRLGNADEPVTRFEARPPGTAPVVPQVGQSKR